MRIKGSSKRPTGNKRQDKEYKILQWVLPQHIHLSYISAITEDRDLNQSSMWQQKQLTHRIMRIFPHKCTPRLLFNSCIFPFTQTVSLYPSRSVTPMLKKKPNYTKCYTNCCKNLWYLRYLPLISNLLILLSYWASFMYVVCLVL